MRSRITVFNLGLGRVLAVSYLSIVLLALMTGGVAEAHVLKVNNGITAELHIPPNDTPEAGQSTELDLSFGSSNDTFSLKDCNCQIVIKHNNQILQRMPPKPVASGAVLNSVNFFQFPSEGDYNVIVTGSAKDGTFSAFSLDYPVHIAESKETDSSKGRNEAVILIGAGGLMALVLIVYAMLRRAKHH